jgi:sarcosine oxidase subunit delta
MIQLPCPWCGPRNVSEFRYAGEGTPRPDPATTTPREWRAHLYLRRNVRGWVEESWYLRVQRDTVSNETRLPDRTGRPGAPR